MATSVIAGVVYDDAGQPAPDRIVRIYSRSTGAMLGETITQDGPLPTPEDPYWGDVVLAMHMNEPDGATAFTDEKGGLSSSTNVVASGGMAYFDGSAQIAISTPDLSGVDFTVEAWVEFSSGVGTMAIITLPGYEFYRRGATGFLSVWNGTVYNGGAVVPLNELVHCAWSKEGNTHRLFVNGVLQHTFSLSGGPTAGTAFIGSWVDGSERLVGYMSDLRITSGVARYTGNFTPPARPFPDADDLTPTDRGRYEIAVDYVGEVQRIVLDDAAGLLHNDLIDRIDLP
jgi:hypothetical protein